MDELIDILDPDGNMTHTTAMKSEAHKNGWFHQTVHIWLYTSDGEILLQQRGKEKNIYPLLWDVSVAGHIGAGESILTSAVREVQEEIGLKISSSDLEKIGIFKSVKNHSETLKDYEFHHTFIAELKTPFSALQKQDSEVEALKLESIKQFIKALNDTSNYKYVPHDISYFETILEEISNRLNSI
ncbi:isopentenyldiphosphate isomerase [Maribacter spongiicola]|uniref:Isopentenyldiphosphate isomerase n=1 Tax=Maribacter spongiicola TaxID=1206753 RepID=A0A4R7K753_9FLAO|nr:NUDIX domain-containing protein [Maribacter spongiicola]TDT45509.1 isopentenyldiphosphate isomerase [Maribacter spongiicola]